MIPKAWDERHYLFDEEEIKRFEDGGRYHKEKFLEEKIKYKEALEYYDKFIEEIAKLLKHLGYSSGLECANMISYLINTGFLSVDKMLKDPSFYDKKEIYHRLGTSIVKGNNDYRNHVNMLFDILTCDAIDIPTDRLYCYKGNPKYGLDREANYAVNLIPHGTNVYGIDIYDNNKLFKFDSSFVLSDINPKVINYLLYKPYLEMDLGERKFSEVLRKIDSFEFLSTRPPISYDEYKEIKDNAENKMIRHHYDFCDFHEDNKKLMKKIVKNINKQK